MKEGNFSWYLNFSPIGISSEFMSRFLNFNLECNAKFGFISTYGMEAKSNVTISIKMASYIKNWLITWKIVILADWYFVEYEQIVDCKELKNY